MKYYETMVIIHPALEQGRLKDNIVSFHANINKKGGEVVATEVWGKKRLAYYVDKQKYGTYVLLQFSGEKVNITELNTDMEHNANILAYLTIKIDKDGIREQEHDLDTQIAGRSSATPKTEESVDKSNKNAETPKEVINEESSEEKEVVTEEKPEVKTTEEEK
jgi:small subunit ribosomal protein S6